MSLPVYSIHVGTWYSTGTYSITVPDGYTLVVRQVDAFYTQNPFTGFVVHDSEDYQFWGSTFTDGATTGVYSQWSGRKVYGAGTYPHFVIIQSPGEVTVSIDGYLLVGDEPSL